MKKILLPVIYISNFFYNECGCIRKGCCKDKNKNGNTIEDTGMIEKKELGIKLDNVKVEYITRKNFKFENGNEIFKKLFKNIKDNGSEIILNNNENVNHITKEKYNKFKEYYKIKENRDSLTDTEKNFLEIYLKEKTNDKKVESDIEKKIQEEAKKKKDQENLLHENKKKALNSLKESITALDIDKYNKELKDIINDYNPNENNKKLIDEIYEEIAKKNTEIIENKLKSEKDEKEQKNIIVNALTKLKNESKNKTYSELSSIFGGLKYDKFKDDVDVKKLIDEINKIINNKKKEEEKQQRGKECIDKLNDITNNKIYKDIISNEKFFKKISDICKKINSISDEKSKNDIIKSIEQLEDELKKELIDKAKVDEEIIEEETGILFSVENDVIFNSYEKIKNQFEEILKKQEDKKLKGKILKELDIIKKDLDNINETNKKYSKITEKDTNNKDTNNILYVLGFKAFNGNKVAYLKNILFDFKNENDCFQVKNLKEIGSKDIKVTPIISKEDEKKLIATITCSKTTAGIFKNELTNKFYEYNIKEDGFKIHVDSDAEGNNITPDIYTDIIYRCYYYKNCTYLFILNTLHYDLGNVGKLADMFTSWFKKNEEKTDPTKDKGLVVKQIKKENDNAVRKIIEFIKDQNM